MISKTTLPKIMFATLMTVLEINAAETSMDQTATPEASGALPTQMELKGSYQSIPAPLDGMMGVAALGGGLWAAASGKDELVGPLVGVTTAAAVLLFLAYDQYHDNSPIKININNTAARRVTAKQAAAARLVNIYARKHAAAVRNVEHFAAKRAEAARNVEYFAAKQVTEPRKVNFFEKNQAEAARSVKKYAIKHAAAVRNVEHFAAKHAVAARKAEALNSNS